MSYFLVKYTRLTDIGLLRNRILCITSKYVINLKRDRDRLDEDGMPDLTGLSMKRIIEVANLKGVTKSIHNKSFELVIHVPSEYDYRYSTKNERTRDEIIKSLKLAYLTEMKDDLLIYGVPDRYLGKYTKTSREKQKITKIPDDSFILQEECLQLNNSKSLIQSSTLQKQLSMGSEDFDIIPYEEKSKTKKNSQYKKSHSAVCSDETNEESDEKGNKKRFDNIEYSSDEEQKILDEISDNENDISFNLDDEDFDIF